MTDGQHAGFIACGSCWGANPHVQRVYDDGYTKMLEKYVQSLEEEFLQCDRSGRFQRLTSLSTNDKPKENPQYIGEEEAWVLQELRRVLGRWGRFFGTLLKIQKMMTSKLV